MANIDWPTASVIISILLVVGKLLVDFLSGKYSKDLRESGKQNLRIADEKWKTTIFVQLEGLAKGQKHMETIVNRFKDDVQRDIDAINKRVDDFVKYLTKRIDEALHKS